MRLLRSGNVFIATRTTGPTQNFLGLDFTERSSKYTKDLADCSDPAIQIDSVQSQVAAALGELEVDTTSLSGIQYVGTDSPSDTVYYELAKAIIEHRQLGTELDEFSPSWSPDDCEA